METRNFDLDGLDVRRAADKPPVIRGHAAVFNSLSEPIMGMFRERIEPGAFQKSLKTADVRALINHDANFVLGRQRGVQKDTLRVAEDDKGLAIEIDPPDTQAARDLMVSIERGDITQMSFAFRTIRDSWAVEDGEDIRTLHEVELHDVSPVTFPAYLKTDVAVRSGAADEARQSFDAWKATEELDAALVGQIIDRERDAQL